MYPKHNQRHQDNRCHTEIKQCYGTHHKYYGLKRRSRGRDANFGSTEPSWKIDERNKRVLEQAYRTKI